MLKDEVNIQVLNVDRYLITLFKHLDLELRNEQFAFNILVRIASYRSKIDQSHGEN